MDLLEEYKDLYYREIEHAEKLNSKIQTCITFLTIIGGGITLEWAQLKNFQHNWYFYLYMLLCFITSICYFISLIKFVKAYTGYKVSYYPIKEMSEYIDDILQAYGITYEHSLEEHKTVNAYLNYMVAQKYLEDAIIHRKNNQDKNKRHRNLIKWIIVTAIFALISYVVLTIIDYYEATYIVEEVKYCVRTR